MGAEQFDRRITIGVNQYITIIHLFIYEQRITSKVYITILHILWVILAVLNLLGNYVEIIFWSICKELVIVIALISLTIVGYFYACILLKARQVRSQISSYNKREGNSIKNRAKAAWTSLIILFTFLICYRPVTAYLVFEIVTGNNVKLGQKRTWN